MTSLAQIVTAKECKTVVIQLPSGKYGLALVPILDAAYPNTYFQLEPHEDGTSSRIFTLINDEKYYLRVIYLTTTFTNKFGITAYKHRVNGWKIEKLIPDADDNSTTFTINDNHVMFNNENICVDERDDIDYVCTNTPTGVFWRIDGPNRLQWQENTELL